MSNKISQNYKQNIREHRNQARLTISNNEIKYVEWIEARQSQNKIFYFTINDHERRSASRYSLHQTQRYPEKKFGFRNFRLPEFNKHRLCV